MKHIISLESMEKFREKMWENERSKATVEKYLRDIRTFITFAGEECMIDKDTVIAYKTYLLEKYAPASVNSMLAAINSFFKENGWYDCVVKAIKIQKEALRSENKELTREEYYRLLQAAKRRENRRLYMVIQTICSTGIRVSELEYITVEALHTRRAVVSLKGKTRMVILPIELCRELKQYVKERDIKSGAIFVTRSGKPMNRSNIWKEMKELCESAGVDKEKVFPHNLRHLFACTYYQLNKDITHLADILGHSNINTTRIYTLVSGEEQEKQISMLGLVV
jgi:site-specific recombinase XerD